jgi:hypothetical protein
MLASNNVVELEPVGQAYRSEKLQQRNIHQAKQMIGHMMGHHRSQTKVTQTLRASPQPDEYQIDIILNCFVTGENSA